MTHWRGIVVLILFIFIFWCAICDGRADERPELVKTRQFLSKLFPSTAANLRAAGRAFDTGRSFKVQKTLFREHLVWLNRNYSTMQMDLMVFIVITLSLENEPDPKRPEAVKAYRSQAIILIRRLSHELEDISDYEFGFRY